MKGVIRRKDDLMKKPNGKEELFCRLYVSLGNAREAACRAGYRLRPDIQADKLLSKPHILNYIEKLRSERKITAYEVRNGLHRLAFASSADAVRLLFSESMTDEEIEALDLFNVAEIKRPKGGGLEIKFFDRIKALEKLGDISEASADDPAKPFYEALEKSALSLSGGEV